MALPLSAALLDGGESLRVLVGERVLELQRRVVDVDLLEGRPLALLIVPNRRMPLSVAYCRNSSCVRLNGTSS